METKTKQRIQQMLNEFKENGTIISLRGGKAEYITVKGLLLIAHEIGLKSIICEPVSRDREGAKIVFAETKATVTLNDGRMFTSYGDASISSVSRNIHPHICRMAETRAIGRALRNATGVDICTQEELDNLQTIMPKNNQKNYRNNNQKNSNNYSSEDPNAWRDQWK